MKNIKGFFKIKICFIIILSVSIFPFAMTGCSCSCLILPPFPYNWSEWTITTDPTCDTYGEEARVCQNDPSRTETRPVPPSSYNHNFSEWININERVLIIERENYSSDKLADILREEFYVSIVNIADALITYGQSIDPYGRIIDPLLLYGQIILNNISSADMPLGLDMLLSHFVSVYGRSLFTTGGFRYCDETGEMVPNLYCFYDLRFASQSSLFRRALPVEAVRNFVPPIALTMVVDMSGAMNVIDPGQRRSRIEIASRAVELAVSLLNPWDYASLVVFDGSARTERVMTLAGQSNEFWRIGSIAGAGRRYGEALRRAFDLQRPMRDRVYHRHIMLITVGDPHDEGGFDVIYPRLGAIRDEGISLSVLAIDSDLFRMYPLTPQRMAERMGELGSYYIVSTGDLVEAVIQVVANLAIEYYEFNPFRPRLQADTNHVIDIPYLNGFFAVRARIEYREQTGLVSLLTGPYGLPLHAQWDFGEGRVASFMSTLNGDEWSYEFMSDETGQQLILNMVRALMPSEATLVRVCRCGFIEIN